jgi:uncharacterized RDD family membrane protein YckC
MAGPDAPSAWRSDAASASIITPEAVVLELRPGGVASRTLAACIDALALALTMTALYFAAAVTIGGFEGVGAAVLAVVASLLVVLGWFCAFETLWRGRTPGKAALGLRVVGTDGTPVRFQQAFLRAVLGLVDFFLVPVGVVAVVTVLVSPRDQRLGDMAAGTLVVRERSAVELTRGPAWFPPPAGYEAYAASLDVGALDERGYGVVRSYLLRWPQLTPAARDHLAVRLANPIAMRMDHAPPRHVHPHVFLVCVAAAWQRAHGQFAEPAWGVPPPRPR